jgi:hypothetical protein
VQIRVPGHTTAGRVSLIDMTGQQQIYALFMYCNIANIEFVLWFTKTNSRLQEGKLTEWFCCGRDWGGCNLLRDEPVAFTSFKKRHAKFYQDKLQTEQFV